MGRYLHKIHELEPERWMYVEQGHTQTALCSALITKTSQVTRDLATLPREQRCMKCWRSKAGGSSDRSKLREIELLAMTSESGTVPAQQILSIVLRD